MATGDWQPTVYILGFVTGIILLAFSSFMAGIQINTKSFIFWVIVVFLAVAVTITFGLLTGNTYL